MKYQKFTQLEHVLARPDTYVGSLENESDKQWVLNADKTEMIQKSVTHVPGLYKIFDEILVNAIDQTVVDSTVDCIKVAVDKDEGTISVMNNGKGIPIEIHEKENMWIPEMIFGELLTSSNYDDTQKRTVGGRNGYGAKLANIFSKCFTIEIVNAESGQKYVQTFSNNMTERTKPSITKKKSANGYVKFTFIPDLARFNMTKLDDDIVSLFEKRTYDACACTNDKVSVHYNGKKLGYKNFEKYVDLYIGGKKTTARVFDSGKRWDVCVCHSEDGYKQVSFVNGINTSVGGTHIDHVVRQLINKVTDKILLKNPNSQVKANFIREHMFVFVKATIENPSFSSQTKTECTTKVQNFGSRFECSEEFTKRLLKLQILDDAVALAKHKEMRDLSKTDGRKKTTIKNIPKLDDANKAGTSKSKKCTLLLTEGDSAKTFAISGLSIIGRDYWGVFPLRGKLLNVREASPKQLMDNAEINALKQIIGLQQGKEYKNTDDLRYGGIMILTDADVDGSHIKGLIINFIHYFWPSLLNTGFEISTMVTPVIKVSNRSEQHSFYTINDFNAWKEAQPNGLQGYKIKYYKGLGTSTSAEAKEYFRDLATNTVKYTIDEDTDDSIMLAFKKDQADKRKQWILEGIKGNDTIEYASSLETVSYREFIHKDMIWFSIADLERSIPSMVDGLKPSQRKVLFACRKRTNKEIKVSQLAGYVSTESAYHHGEQSMMGTIISLAQNFVGSNTYNLLEPIGQFGTRLMGGKDAASPRYIFTHLSSYASALFEPSDDAILEYLTDDGMQIEPKYYVPILPLVLINGAEGIGTGYSCSVPCFNPIDVKRNTLACMKGKPMDDITPWYPNFTGTIEKTGEGAYVTRGCYKVIANNYIEITELPIGKWTQDYKEFLDGITDTKIVSYTNHSTENIVKFLIKIEPQKLKKLIDSGDVHKEFRLTSTLSTRNMHLFDSTGSIKKYPTANSIIAEYVKTRICAYKARKAYLIDELNKKVQLLENKVTFVTMITQESLVVFKKKKQVIENELRKLQFGTVNGSYEYLLGMKIWALTTESIVELETALTNAKKTLESVSMLSPEQMWENDLS